MKLGIPVYDPKAVWRYILFFVLILVGCVASKLIVVEKSLPQSELTNFTDTFDTLNEELWEQYAESSDWQMENFKMADVKFNGQLIIETKKDAYSRGTLHSKFHLRGDYDIQIDCEAAIKEISGNMTTICILKP